MRASSFAAAATLRGGEPCTLIETSGVWPCFATAPATAAVEIPERSTPGFRAVSAETLRIVDSARTIWRTVLGFDPSGVRPRALHVAGLRPALRDVEGAAGDFLEQRDRFPHRRLAASADVVDRPGRRVQRGDRRLDDVVHVRERARRVRIELE